MTAESDAGFLRLYRITAVEVKHTQHKGKKYSKAFVWCLQSTVISFLSWTLYRDKKKQRESGVSQSIAEENYRDSLRRKFLANYTINPPTVYGHISLFPPSLARAGDTTHWRTGKAISAAKFSRVSDGGGGSVGGTISLFDP